MVCGLSLLILLSGWSCCSREKIPLASKYFDLRDPRVTVRRLYYAAEAGQVEEVEHCLLPPVSDDSGKDLATDAQIEALLEICKAHPLPKAGLQSIEREGEAIVEWGDGGQVIRWLLVPTYFVYDYALGEWTEVTSVEGVPEGAYQVDWRIDPEKSGVS